MAITVPSAWIRRQAGLVPAGAAVLDLACGGGRHTRLFRALGHPVTAVDIDLKGLGPLAEDAGVEAIEADLENGPWPLAGRTFGGVVVTNYLWRPLLPLIVAAVAPGGALLYETFAIGQERFGKPSNPDFLLRPDELLAAVSGQLSVRVFEHFQTDEPAMRQRIAAVRPA